jgi:hypothetical protein
MPARRLGRPEAAVRHREQGLAWAVCLGLVFYWMALQRQVAD